MLKKITIVLFIVASLATLVGCNEESKQQKSEQITQEKPKMSKEEADKKALESRYKPSEPKVW